MDRTRRDLAITSGLIFCIWTAVVLAVAGNCYLHGALGAEEGGSFARSFIGAAPTWYGWALLTPLVLWLARRLRLTRNRWAGRLGVLIVCGLAISVLEVFVGPVVGALWLEPGSWSWPTGQELALLVLRRLPVHLGIFTAVVVVWYAGEYYRHNRERELQTARLGAQLAVAELRALKMQLHPHFVLNALNTIAAMITRDPDRAEEMVVRMGELLRMALDSREAHLVSLPSEIEFLEKYLEIERTRFGEQLEVRLEVAQSLDQALVPSLLLQPFVENAIKHRALRPDVPTRITIRAWAEGSRLRFQVADNGQGWPAEPSPSRRGLGIANTRARLDALYGDDYELRFSAASPAGLCVDLDIPYRRAQPVGMALPEPAA